MVLSPHNQDPHLQIKAPSGGGPEKLLTTDNSLRCQPPARPELERAGATVDSAA